MRLCSVTGNMEQINVNEGQKMKSAIMRRVYFMWTLKRLTTPAMVKFYIFAVLVSQFFSYVSVPSVFVNATPHADLERGILFFQNAFANTDLLVQGLVLATFAFTLLLAVDMVKKFPLPNVAHKMRSSF